VVCRGASRVVSPHRCCSPDLPGLLPEQVATNEICLHPRLRAFRLQLVDLAPSRASSSAARTTLLRGPDHLVTPCLRGSSVTLCQPSGGPCGIRTHVSVVHFGLSTDRRLYGPFGTSMSITVRSVCQGLSETTCGEPRNRTPDSRPCRFQGGPHTIAG